MKDPARLPIMAWAGPVVCPNCGLPIDSDVSVCPYCYSTEPQTAPWQPRGVGRQWWSYALLFVGMAVFVAAMVSDAYFETRWVSQILEYFKDE
jgi:hypothetical protein